MSHKCTSHVACHTACTRLTWMHVHEMRMCACDCMPLGRSTACTHLTGMHGHEMKMIACDCQPLGLIGEENICWT